MDARIEGLLTTLAGHYAASILTTWNRAGDYPERCARLARTLADHGVFVLLSDYPNSLQSISQDVNALVQNWVNGYLGLYQSLAKHLLPSFSECTLHHTDQKWPLLVYLHGKAPPITGVLAGYVSPFIVRRQMQSTVSEAELVGLMELILDKLEAGNLPQEVYKKLRAEGIRHLRQMLIAPVQQLPLTEFDEVLFTDTHPMQALADVPFAHRSDTQRLHPTQMMQLPNSLPETQPLNKPLPIFIKDEPPKRPPPIPPIPSK